MALEKMAGWLPSHRMASPSHERQPTLKGAFLGRLFAFCRISWQPTVSTRKKIHQGFCKEKKFQHNKIVCIIILGPKKNRLNNVA